MFEDDKYEATSLDDIERALNEIGAKLDIILSDLSYSKIDINNEINKCHEAIVEIRKSLPIEDLEFHLIKIRDDLGSVQVASELLVDRVRRDMHLDSHLMTLDERLQRIQEYSARSLFCLFCIVVILIASKYEVSSLFRAWW